MGKMKGDIYKYYMLKYDTNDPANSNPRLPKWQCRFCSKQYVQNATKMRHHVLNMCGEIPAPLKLALLDIPNVNVYEDSNDETKAFLHSLGMVQSSTDTVAMTVSSPTTSSVTVSSSPNNSSKLSPLSPKKIISKPPPKKRRTLSLTPPASSHTSSHSANSHQHPNKFSNLNLTGSAPNALTSFSSVNSDQESLWVILARALYSSGTSMSIVENPYWAEVFERISPGLSLPSKQLLSRDLLDKEVLKIQSEVEKQVADAKYVSLQCEAWMNWRGESMITFVVTTPTPFSYKTFPTGGTHHSDTIIADCASSTIRDVEAIPSNNALSLNSSNPSKVLAVVSTTKSYMKSAWTKIHAMYPDLLTFGCIIEGLELFLESILEHTQISEVLSIIRSATGKIRRSPVIKSKFDQIQSQLSPSGKVRKLRMLRRNMSKFSYLSFLVSLQSILNSQTTLKWLAVDEESLEVIGEDLSLFMSDEFWLKVQILCKILFPTVKWLNYMKDPKAKSEISSVPKAFAEIQQALEDNLANSIWQESVYPALMESLDKRKEDCLHSVHLAAHLLDPREQGSCLDQDQVLQATEFIDNFSEMYDFNSSAVIAELSQFRMRTEFYSKPFLWKVTKKVQGSIWWTTMAPKTHLAQLAAAILNIPPSSFAMDSVITESSFTESSESHKNRTHEPATSSGECKLIYVAHNLRLRCRGTLEGGGRRGPRESENTEGGDDGVPTSNSNCNNSISNGTAVDWTTLDSIPDYLLSESESDDDDDFDGDDNEQIIIVEHDDQEHHQLQQQAEGSDDPLKDSYTDIKIVSATITEPGQNSFYRSS